MLRVAKSAKWVAARRRGWEGWLGIRVTRGVTGVADGIGEIFEYLMARDDKDEIKRGGNSGFRRLSSRREVKPSHQLHRREKSRLRMLRKRGGEVSFRTRYIPYRVPRDGVI